MKLPNREYAYIPVEKSTDYLLSSSHPEGGPKSVVFELMGYSKENVVDLENALLLIANEQEIIENFEFPFGTKCIVDGKLPRKQGTEIPIRTVWVIDPGETNPRFVTAYPL